MRLNSDRSA